MGWLLATLVLSGINDSAQAWWGRRFGHRRLAPVISPGKTWAGLAGGVLTTALVAVWVLPLLTSVGRDAWVVGVPAGAPAVRRGPGAVGPVAGLYVVPPHLVAGGLGALLAVGGLLGDLVVSGVKRRAGVKDSGTLLPGQGGLLDRFDSLMVTAALMAWVGWS
jgi:phosphatidate cytidylyltransferase